MIDFFPDDKRYVAKCEKCQLALNKNTSTEKLKELSKDSNYIVRTCVALNDNTPAEVFDELDNIDELAKYGGMMAELIAFHPNASKHILDLMSKSICPDLINKVAWNKNTSEETLDYLATLPENNGWYCRFTISKNPNTSKETLDHLSKKDDCIATLCNVASHPNTSEETLKHLSKDSCADVRLAVVRNRNTTKETLDHLKSDDDRSVKYELSLLCKG